MALLAALGGVIYAGPLAPPAGPAATGPTQIFQPASCAAFPIVLSSSGSYVLAGNITKPGGCNANGIEIGADGVTLDLAGFTLGAGTGTGDGITNPPAAPSRSKVIVRNGVVSGWGGDGLRLILFDSVSVEGVISKSNGVAGIRVFLGATIKDCAANDNGDDGIVAQSYAVVSNCDAFNNGSGGFGGGSGNGITLGTGSVLTDCTASSNRGYGISITGATLDNCSANNNNPGIGIVSSASTLTNCVVTGNTLGGVNAIRSTISACTADSNTVYGFSIQDSNLTGCVANFTLAGGAGTGRGILAAIGGRISQCTAIANAASGIEVTGGDIVVVENHTTDNSVAGIRVVGGRHRIESNDASTQAAGARGIWVDGNNNSIVNNTANQNPIEGILILSGTGDLIDSNHASGNTGNNIAVAAPGGTPNIITRNWATLGGAGNYAIGAGNDAAPRTTAAAAVNPMANIAQ